MATQIWLITEGEYSEYCVVAAFSTKDRALSFADSWKPYLSASYRESPQVEEFPLDPENLNAPPGTKLYSVRMNREGEADAMEDDFFDIDYGRRHLGGRLCRGKKPEDTILLVFCFAKSEEHAIKIANEKRAQLIAGNEWRGENNAETSETNDAATGRPERLPIPRARLR